MICLPVEGGRAFERAVPPGIRGSATKGSGRIASAAGNRRDEVGARPGGVRWSMRRPGATDRRYTDRDTTRANESPYFL